MMRLVEPLRLSWERFFHAPCDARLIALLRIGFATLVLMQALLMLPQLHLLWSVHGMLPLDQLHDVAGGFVPTLFSVLPRSDLVLWLGYALLLLHAGLLLVGYRARLQLICTVVWLISFQNRNPLVLNGQDAVLRLIGFFLTMTPVGAAWSVDRRRGAVPARPPGYFPIRLLQAQIAIVMLSAGIWKLRGDDWVNGTALYYVTRLEGFWGNLPLPSAALDSRLVLRSLSYATLALELCVPILIWLPRTRRAALGVALGFHACLAYSMNLFLFAPIMMLGWCAFLERPDFEWFARRLKGGAPKHETLKGELA
jgi:hypothetical protein